MEAYFYREWRNAFALQRIMGYSTMDMTKKYVSMENKNPQGTL